MKEIAQVVVGGCLMVAGAIGVFLGRDVGWFVGWIGLMLVL